MINEVNEEVLQYVIEKNKIDIITDKEFVICIYSEKASSMCKVTVKDDNVSSENIDCASIEQAKEMVYQIKPSPVVANIARNEGKFYISRKNDTFLVQEEYVNGQVRLTFGQTNVNILNDDEQQNDLEETQNVVIAERQKKLKELEVDYLIKKSELLSKLKNASSTEQEIDIKTDLIVLERRYEINKEMIREMYDKK